MENVENRGRPRGRGRKAVVERLSARVPSWYSPIAHLALNMVLTLALVTLVLLQLRGASIRWWAWFALPGALVFANLVEYAIHRFPMHRRMRFLYRFFRGHTLVHHRYFDHQDYELQSSRDAYFVLTTAHTSAVSALILIGGYFALAATIGTDVAALATVAMAGYSVASELLHVSFHMPRGWLERRFFYGTWFRSFCEHHLLHHDPRVMTRYNFNIVFPLMDWLLRTRLLATRAVDSDAGDLPATEGLEATQG